MMIILNRGDQWWYTAELPPLRHECKTQTSQITDTRIVSRCACGAIRYYPGPWLNVNSRRGVASKQPSRWERILRRMGL